MAGWQDIVLAPVSSRAPSPSANRADIVCYSLDATPSNIVMGPINSIYQLGLVSITLVPLSPRVLPLPVTLVLFSTPQPVKSLSPNSADILLMPLPPSTKPNVSNLADIFSIPWDVIPSNIILNFIGQTGSPGPTINNITLAPLFTPAKVAPQVSIIMGPLNPTTFKIPASGVTYYATLRRWNGSAWLKEPLCYWTGSSWVVAKLNYWAGSQWRLVDTTGV